MNKFLTLLLFTLTPLVATAAPKVVFFGDNYTVNWTSAFTANPNWINKGVASTAFPTNVTAGALAQDFNADVVALHPAVVHIMIGMGDAGIDDDANFRFTNPSFLSGLESMVSQAKAAHIQVVLGIEPLCGPSGGFTFNAYGQESVNTIVGIYGAQNNIPVINYGDALCRNVGYTAGPIANGSAGGSASTAAAVYGANNTLFNYFTTSSAFTPLPNSAGYDLMTSMAEATINTIGVTRTGGYLQNSQVPDDNEDNTEIANLNVNTVSPAGVVQFIPYGTYSNGKTYPLTNTTFLGTSYGTWASSNPLVMWVNQQGQAFAISPGTAIITYTPSSGARFHEWIMYVLTPFE